MALGQGTPSDFSMGPGYPTQGSWGAAITSTTGTVTIGFPVSQYPLNSTNVVASKVGG